MRALGIVLTGLVVVAVTTAAGAEPQAGLSGKKNDRVRLGRPRRRTSSLRTSARWRRSLSTA